MPYGYKKKFLSRRDTSNYITSRRALSQYRAGTLRRRGSTDQRQLANVVQLHRLANPYQVTPSSGRTVTFWRKTEINFQLGQTTGFQGGGKNINFGFSLGRVFGWIDGVFTISSVTPNFNEFQALFDYYKINAVKMQVFFTKTTSDQGSTGNSSVGMPILLIANDFDDIQETMTLFSMMERVGCRHVQFDASSQRGICHYVKPKVSNTVVQTDITTGLTSTSPAGIVFGSQWLDCAISNIVHSGIKVYYDNQGLTTAGVIGNISFVFDVCYEFKGYR